MLQRKKPVVLYVLILLSHPKRTQIAGA